MAKRHTHDTNQLQSVVYRLQELVAANSGENTFSEVFKLLIAKVVSEDNNTDWNLCCNQADPALSIREAQYLLAKANQKWPQIAGELPEIKLTPAHFPICAAVLKNVNIRRCGLDILDHSFEFLTSAKSKGNLGQYFTPRHVIEACVRLARPKHTDLILDPACGSGGFLFHSWTYLKQGTNTSPCSKQFWGTDFDERAVSVARAMMLLSGADDARVMRLNSLLMPSEPALFSPNSSPPETTLENLMALHGVKRGFDLILTNPPFAGEIAEQDLLSKYDNAKGLKRVERDTLFIERCVNLLSPNGKLVIVLPHNKFGGKSFMGLREWIFKNTHVLGVIGLDRHAFTPHTHQKTNILLCKRRKNPIRTIPKSEKIFFGISERTGRDSSGNDIVKPHSNEASPSWEKVDHDLSELVASFHDFIKTNEIDW